VSARSQFDHVVNPVSGVAVGGPYLDLPKAQRAAARLNDVPPAPPDRLGPGKVQDF